MTHIPKFSKLLFILVLFAITSIHAQVLRVPSAVYPTIQAGIDSSHHGDTILVAPGEYFENINFNGKNILLTSNFILDSDTSFISTTIINGNQNGSVVTFNSGEDSTAQLVGFTITNGHALYGAGIFCENSNPTFSYINVQNNIINGGSNDQHNGRGAGLYFKNSLNVRFYSILVRNNVIDYGSDPRGCGISIDNSSVFASEIIVSSNKGFPSVKGWGIYLEQSYLEINSSDINQNNRTDPPGGTGGGIFATTSISAFFLFQL